MRAPTNSTTSSSGSPLTPSTTVWSRQANCPDLSTHCSKFSDVAKQAFIFYALSGIIARTVFQCGLRGKIQGQTILLQSFIGRYR